MVGESEVDKQVTNIHMLTNIRSSLWDTGCSHLKQLF